MEHSGQGEFVEGLIRRSGADIRKNGRVFEAALAAVGNERVPSVSFSQLAEHLPADKVPFLDRPYVDEAALTPLQKHWRDKGYVVLPGLIPQTDIDEYECLRNNLGLGKAMFDNFTPYVEHDVIRRISLKPALNRAITEIMGQDMGLHFILTAYHSTERAWHQDDYLNPDYVCSNYCAVWISLGHIDPDAGPFEFIEGSHKWPCVRRHLVHQFMPERHSQISGDAEGNHWAAYAEVFTNEAYAREIEEHGLPISQFIARPGDVLIWNGKLVHRGAPPNRMELERPAMISHFSGTKIRSDIGTDIRRYGEDGGFYWHFEAPKR